jgi:hypothetical protein
MTLDKHLARCAQECRQLDADRWSLALTNGHLLTVSARHDEGFLLLDADTGVRPAEERLSALAGCALTSAVKFAMRRPWPAVRLRAEFPLPEESGAAGERIREHLDGMRSALDELHARIPGEDAAEQPGAVSAIPDNLTELLKDAGWVYHERPGGALLVDLETGSRFLQAEIGGCGAGVQFRVTLYRNNAAGTDAGRSLCLYLLEANAALRYARAFLRREREVLAAGFEVRVEGAPSAAEAGHALAALSVAGLQCAREMEALLDGAVAGIYRSARPALIHNV